MNPIDFRCAICKAKPGQQCNPVKGKNMTLGQGGHICRDRGKEEMEPLKFPCSRCLAQPGERCKNYRGEFKVTCKYRGNEQQKHVDATAKKNDQLREEIPLFFEYAEKHTVEDVKEKARRSMVSGVIRHNEVWIGGRMLRDMQMVMIRRYVRRVVGAEAFAKLDAYAKDCFRGCKEYYYGFWRDVLAGKRIVFKMERVENRKPGEKAVREVEWYEQQHMTKEEFYTLFPYKPMEPPPPHDDGGVCAQLDEMFARRREATCKGQT